MNLDRSKFYKSLRPSLGSFTQEQVEGFELFLDGFEAENIPLYHAAYMLATAWHETARTMQPVTEYGGVRYFDKYDTGRLAKVLGNTPQKDGDGFLYRGRGYVQITGAANYKKLSQILGMDIYSNPDLALNPKIAWLIMLVGMQQGLFTSRSLHHYLDKKPNYVEARYIINGQDAAQTIASYAKTFQKALEIAGYL